MRKTHSIGNMGKTSPNGFMMNKFFPEKKLPEITNPVYINNLFHIWNRDDDIKETLKPQVFITNKKESRERGGFSYR